MNNSKTNHSLRVLSRSRLLCGVGTAVLVAMIASPAHAADTNSILGSYTASGALVKQSTQIDSGTGTVLANADGSAFSITIGTEALVNNLVLGNSVTAIAGANLVTHNVGTLLGGVGTGLASLIYQDNNGSIFSSADSNIFSIDIDANPTGNAQVDGNSASATTTVNKARSSFITPVAIGFNGSTAGDSFFFDLNTPGGGIYTTDGDIVAHTEQSNGAGGSGTSEATDNAFTLNVDSNGAAASNTSTPSVSDNSASSTYAGNDTNAVIELQDTGIPTFTGSAVVLSYQYNGLGAHNNGPEAFTDGTDITANVGSSAVDPTDPAFAGQLKVSGNTVSSSATGNSALDGDLAGNRIVLDGSLNFGGPGGGLDNFVVTFPGFLFLDVDADLVVNSVQQNVDGGRLTAWTNDTLVQGTVQSSDGATLTVADNTVSSEGAGNAATNSVSTGSTSASFDGTIAVSNFQNNESATLNSETRARTRGTDILATVGDGGIASGEVLTDSTVSLAGNTVSSTANGNSSAQLIDITSNTVDIGTGPVGLGTFQGGGFLFQGLDGTVTLNNMQFNLGSSTTAETQDSAIQLSVDIDPTNDVIGSTLGVTGNMQEAFARGNSTTNDLDLSGNTVGTGAGINSGQLNIEFGDGFDANVSAEFTGSAGIDVAQDVGTSNLSVAGNTQKAVAVGNGADNGMSIDANLIDTDGTDLLASSIDTGATQTNASYAIQNVQGQFSDVSGTVDTDGSLLTIVLAGALTDSTIGVNGNAIGAGAFGNDAVNTLDLAVNDLTVSDVGDGTYATIAAITNGQYANGAVSALVEPDTTAILVSVTGAVDPSTVTANANSFEAVAYGSRTTANDLNVTGNSIVSYDSAVTTGFVDNSAPIEADAAFVVQSAQLNEDGLVSAIVDNASNVPDILIELDATVTDGVVSADDNSVTATAVNQSAVNGLTIDANELQATAAIQNYQESNGGALATAGARDNGITIDIGTDTTNAVSDSTLSISGNSRSASAVGNQGATALDVTANILTAAGNNASATADSDSAEADFTLGNTQDVTGSPITASAFSNLFIDVFDGTGVTDITDSTIRIDDNIQSAVAIGNIGNNDLTVDANNIEGIGDGDPFNTALLSVQRGGDANSPINIDATSSLFIEAPVSVDGSSVSLSGNRNTALAVVNDVSNASSVSAGNLSGGNDATANVLTGNESTVDSDHVVNNIQTAAGTLDANASTSIVNLDAGNVGTNGSAINANGNRTATEATANRASNSLAVTGGNNGASGALANYQSSSTVVNSTASTRVAPSFNGDTGPTALADSTVDAQNNITTALARGNAAENTLNYGGGQLTAASTVATTSLNGAGLTANGNAVLLNSQDNSGAVTGTATLNLPIALNGTGGAASATNSTVLASGNVVNAAAYGNYAVNSLTVSGMSVTGVGAAVASNQVNSGAITAVASANITITGGPGAVNGSSLGIIGNSVTATAIGNNAVNTISN